MQNLYVHELKDIYSAEKRITKALPKLIKGASSPELKKSFEHHLQETERQINRLEEIFQRLDEKADGPKCQGMEGLLKEGNEFLNEDATPEVLDAGIIVGAQKVDHPNLMFQNGTSSYGTLLVSAKT